MNAIDYQRQAEQHKPTDTATLAREVQHLFALGWTEYDIGQALRLDPTSVRRLLIEAAR